MFHSLNTPVFFYKKLWWKYLFIGVMMLYGVYHQYFGGIYNVCRWLSFFWSGVYHQYFGGIYNRYQWLSFFWNGVYHQYFGGIYNLDKVSGTIPFGVYHQYFGGIYNTKPWWNGWCISPIFRRYIQRMLLPHLSSTGVYITNISEVYTTCWWFPLNQQ